MFFCVQYYIRYYIELKAYLAAQHNVSNPCFNKISSRFIRKIHIFPSEDSCFPDTALSRELGLMVIEDTPSLVEDLTLFGGCGALLSLPLLLRCHKAKKSDFISNLIKSIPIPAGTEKGRRPIRGMSSKWKEMCPGRKILGFIELYICRVEVIGN
jgi:hypothetical protein